MKRRATSAEAPATPGETFGRWRVRGLLTRTRMSTLYLADDESTTVVVKVLRRALARDRKHLERFRDEGAVGAAIDHPNVVKTVDRGQHDEHRWIALEHLEGATLAEIMSACTPSSTLDVQAWAWVVARAARGLGAVHGLRGRDGAPLSLVHGDVGPRNLFVTVAGEVVVIDLGLVRPSGERAPTSHPSGTLAYLSPERIEGGVVDHRADLFALGVVLYETTTLRRLFKGETDQATLDNIRQRHIRPPHLCVAEYPRTLEGILLRALAREPGSRWPTAADLEGALSKWAASEGQGPEPPKALIDRAVKLRDLCEGAR